jgi:hypothetical protein
MTNTERYQRDPALWFFGSTALAFLIVSIPATYAIVAPFHNGWVLTVAMLLALEVGAVGCKLAGLAVPSWSKGLNLLTIMLLLLTTIANYAAGSDALAVAKLPPTLASWKAEGWGWAFATIYAGIVPLFLFVFLSLAVRRVVQLQIHAGSTLTLAEQRDQLVIETITLLREQVMQARVLPVAPELLDTKAEMIRKLATSQVEQGSAPADVSTAVIAAATGYDKTYVQQVVSRWRAEQR